MKQVNGMAGVVGSRQMVDSPNEKDAGIQFNMPKDQSVGIIRSWFGAK